MKFTSDFPGPYRIGVYYWPGWNIRVGIPNPWDKIRPYPERQPLLGWYAEGSQEIMNWQLSWMNRYGLSYVVFSHLHNPSGSVNETHAIEAYFRSPERKGLPFAVQWANHTQVPNNYEEFYAIINWVIDNYFKRPEYLRIDGKPVFFIWSGAWMEFNARRFKGSVPLMLAKANDMAKAKGLAGIFFVAGEVNDTLWVNRMHEQGYNAMCAYNYQNPPVAVGRPYSHSYAELDAGYRENWERIKSVGKLPLIVPMTAGWNRKPWGGTAKDPLHDNSSSTVAEFETHLRAAKAFMDKNPEAGKMGVICAWNEWGEGSYIEPTRLERFKRLETVQKVFALKGKFKPGWREWKW